MSQKIFIGSDHAAFEEKQALAKWLEKQDYEVVDVGTKTPERCDYPDYAKLVAAEIQKDSQALGVLLCGSAVGVSMTANRFKKVRAAVCHDANQAILSRQHNNSNILCLGSRVTTEKEHQEIAKAWLASEFEGGRHTQRVALFDDLGEKA